MATRTELRDLTKQRQRILEIVDTSNDIPARTKRLSRSRKECVNDELVKYMSKLPGYLQPMERGEEGFVQSNVLNVGVLDWERLEKWKRDRARGGERSGKSERRNVSTTTLGTLFNESHKCKIDEQVVHTCSNLGKGKTSRDLQHCVQSKVRCTLEPELASKELATCSYKSSGRDEKGVNRGKSRRYCSYRESDSCLLSDMGNSGGSLRMKMTQKLAREIHEQHTRERVTESGKQCVEKLDGEEKIIGDSNTGLAPEKQSRSTHSSEVNRSLDFSYGINSSFELKSQVPRSCPLSFDLDRDSEDMMLPQRFGTRRHSKTASTIFDQEIHEATKKNRHSSPSKRFSLSFGRLSRSFTFKEDTSETVLPSKERSTNMDLPRQDEKKQDTLRTRALFQLTIRNGILLFQFVVDDNNKSNNRSILWATMKNSTSLFKDDSDSVKYCTFYSVNDVKKKKRGSWLIHGHKEKQHEFVYNVIGHSTSSDKKSGKNSMMIRESVLFDESEQVKEVAAVVIKKNYNELVETTVIIPGGVHSFPEKGAPSSLISRWRSGGLCDCGGWDVGCKLHLLSNKTFSDFNRSFKLFEQQGSEQEETSPSLDMNELKSGIYRVEFCSLLSNLQSFFVCVTILTCVSGEEPVVSQINGRSSSSPFAPPLSPAGRV